MFNYADVNGLFKFEDFLVTFIKFDLFNVSVNDRSLWKIYELSFA